MTEQEQRIKIAEACGWKNIGCLPGGNMPEGEPDDDYNRDVCENKNLGGGYPSVPHREPLPDYLHDLNSMHEAIITLDQREQDVFAGFLGELTGGVQRDFGAMRVNATTAILFATAAQWAEAFLKTKGLWK